MMAAAGVTSPNVRSQVDRKIEALRELADFAGSFGSKLRGQLVRRGVAARGDGFDDFIRSLWPNGLAIDADAKIRVASAVCAVASSRGSEELARIVAESGEPGPVLVELQLAKPCRPVDRKSGTIPCERTLGMLKALVSVYKSERGL